MGVKATVKVDIGGVPAKVRRICQSRTVGSFAASELERLAKRYVPYREGILRASAIVSPFLVTYATPYARAMWTGIVKGRSITYHTPGTVSHWERYVDKGALAKSITDYIRVRGF